jgi:flagellin-like protein
MSPPSQSSADRGISPVVGTTLLVAIVVVLAAMLTGVLFGFAEALDAPAPQMGFETTYHADGVGNGDNGAYVNITHVAGETGDGTTIYVVDGDGNQVAWDAVWTGDPTVEAGSYVHIDGVNSDGALNPICTGDEAYRVVARSEDGSSSVLLTYEVPSPPTSTADDCSP